MPAAEIKRKVGTFLDDLGIPKYSKGDVIILSGIEFTSEGLSLVMYEMAIDIIPMANKSIKEIIKPKKTNQENFNLSVFRKSEMAKKDPSNNFKLRCAALISMPF
jgi:hypothetical protein